MDGDGRHAHGWAEAKRRRRQDAIDGLIAILIVVVLVLLGTARW